MGGQSQYYNFQNTEDYLPLHLIAPQVQAHGGELLGRQPSNASSISEMSYSSSTCFSSMPTSPDTIYSLNTQPYDPGQYPQSENVKYTPSSLGWTHGTKLLSLYSFVVPKGQDPYLDLLEDWTPTYETPLRVYLDQPKRIERNRYPCQYPAPCPKQNVFTRPADLERHYKNVHADKKDRFPCDYSKCNRAQEPFSRKDHYRDHLKDFHKEDIGCLKGEKSTKDKDTRTWQETQKKWLAERNISPKNWRCPKCLVKNFVAIVGWECSGCRIPCEEDRIRARDKVALEKGLTAEDASGAIMEEATHYTVPNTYNCATCNDIGWVGNGFGEWIPCTSCQSSAGSSFAYASTSTQYSDRNFNLER